MPDHFEWTQSGALSRVVNESSRSKYIVSTASNRFGVWETCVFVTNRFFIPKKAGNPILVLNASTREQAEIQHRKAVSDFRDQDILELGKVYRFEGGLAVSQHLYSEADATPASLSSRREAQGLFRRLCRFLTGR